MKKEKNILIRFQSETSVLKFLRSVVWTERRCSGPCSLRHPRVFPRCLGPGCLYSRAWHVVQFLVLVSDWLIASRGFDRLDVTCRLLITLCRCFKTVLEQNLSSEKEFDLHVNRPVGETHFYLNGFARRRVLTQKQKTTSEIGLY